MIIYTKQKAYEIERNFELYKTGQNTDYGFVQMKKAANWVFIITKGRGNIHQVNMKWACLINDGEVILNRKKTFDQIIQLVFGVFLTCIYLLLIIGFFAKLIRTFLYGAEIEVFMVIGFIVFSLCVVAYWSVFYAIFYKNVDEKAKKIMNDILN